MATDPLALPDGTHTVAMGVGDLNGILRGKRIPADQWPRVRESGTALSIALFALDMTSDVWDTPYVSMENGYPDMHIVPLGPVYAVPWEEGCAFCFGRALGMDHQPVPIDPRGALEAQVARAGVDEIRDLGGGRARVLSAGPGDGQAGRCRQPGLRARPRGGARARDRSHPAPASRGSGSPSSNRIPSTRRVRWKSTSATVRCWRPRTGSSRSAPSSKELAARHGFLATFMSKPFAAESGSGFHTHYSLWRDGVNAFAGPDGRLSPTGIGLPRGDAGTDGGVGARGGDHAERLSASAPVHLLPHQQFLGTRQPHRRPAGDRGRCGRDSGWRSATGRRTATPTTSWRARSRRASTGSSRGSLPGTSRPATDTSSRRRSRSRPTSRPLCGVPANRGSSSASSAATASRSSRGRPNASSPSWTRRSPRSRRNATCGTSGATRTDHRPGLGLRQGGTAHRSEDAAGGLRRSGGPDPRVVRRRHRCLRRRSRRPRSGRGGLGGAHCPRGEAPAVREGGSAVWSRWMV